MNHTYDPNYAPQVEAREHDNEQDELEMLLGRIQEAAPRHYGLPGETHSDIAHEVPGLRPPVSGAPELKITAGSLRGVEPFADLDVAEMSWKMGENGDSVVVSVFQNVASGNVHGSIYRRSGYGEQERSVPITDPLVRAAYVEYADRMLDTIRYLAKPEQSEYAL